MSRKYALPSFLKGKLEQDAYQKWLDRRAKAHAKRDQMRGNKKATIEAYKRAIHRAVIASNGYDEYTGEKLDWSLVSRYNNAESKQLRRLYKASFALLPTVDHVGDGLGEADFKICAWRTNDAKNDLSHAEFVTLCRNVVKWFEDTGSLMNS